MSSCSICRKLKRFSDGKIQLCDECKRLVLQLVQDKKMKCRYSDESTKKFNPALEVYEHFECDEFLKYDEAHTKNGISYANSWICPKGHIRIILGY